MQCWRLNRQFVQLIGLLPTNITLKLCNIHKHIKFKLVKKCQTPMQYCIHWFCGVLTFCQKSGFHTLIWSYFNKDKTLTTFEICGTKPGLSRPILKNLGFLVFLIFKSDFLLFHVKLCKFLWIHWIYNVQHRSAWASLRSAWVSQLFSWSYSCVQCSACDCA